ncbi:CPBP family intramembrane metalloprotease, partial [Candidatus Woesebacteria bacterium]|nr:CPBP family intramembrane metalloprotease [Candidatus Woesebacteria bacterium]
LLGLAVGGILGFATSIVSLISQDAPVHSVALFTSQQFWGEFLLALFTGFWETILFFSFSLTVLREKYPMWSESNQALLASAIFLVFHLPNILLRFNSVQAVIVQMVLLFLFALGQSFLFIGRRNTFALIISHAIWGMVLLVHTG